MLLRKKAEFGWNLPLGRRARINGPLRGSNKVKAERRRNIAILARRQSDLHYFASQNGSGVDM